MLVSTRGIVLYHADYSETSMIARIYTEQFGLQSFIVKGSTEKRFPDQTQPLRAVIAGGTGGLPEGKRRASTPEGDFLPPAAECHCL